MTLSDYKFCEPNTEVIAIKNHFGWSVLIGGKIACSMYSGSAHILSTPLQAEVFGRQLVRGYTGGSYLASDVDNFLV